MRKILSASIFVSMFLLASPAFAYNSCLSNETINNPNISSSTLNEISTLCDKIDQTQGNVTQINNNLFALLANYANVTSEISFIKSYISSGAIQEQVRNESQLYFQSLPDIANLTESQAVLAQAVAQVANFTNYKTEVDYRFSQIGNSYALKQELELLDSRVQLVEGTIRGENGQAPLILDSSTSIIIVVIIIGVVALFFLFKRGDLSNWRKGSSPASVVEKTKPDPTTSNIPEEENRGMEITHNDELDDDEQMRRHVDRVQRHEKRIEQQGKALKKATKRV